MAGSAAKAGPRPAIWGIALGAVVAIAGPVAARNLDSQDLYSIGDFGGIGALQTRTARFAPDGMFHFGVTNVEPYRNYFITLQALPWLEGTIRYTDIGNRLFSSDPDFSGNQTAKDRAVDFKLRLVPESKYMPQIALGFQDWLGNGLFQGEYLVASKRYYDLDFSLGIGWGYPGARGNLRNPLISFSNGFRTRGKPSRQGGDFDFRSYFSGETVGLFGSVEYRTPIAGLTLKLEVDGNDYKSEPLDNRLGQSMIFNFGATYRPVPWLDAAFAYERGNRLMFRLALRAGLHDSGVVKTDPPPPKIEPRPAAAPREEGSGATGDEPLAAGPEAPSEGWPVNRLFDGVEARGLEIVGFDLSRDEAVVSLSGRSDATDDEIARLVFEAVPGLVERVRIVRRAGDRMIGASLWGEGNVRLDGPPDRPPDRPRDAGAASGAGGDAETADDISERVFAQLDAAGMSAEALKVDGSRATVFVTPRRFRETARSIGRAARVVANNAPPEVEEITVVTMNEGLETGRVTMIRRDLELTTEYRSSPEEIWAHTVVEGTGNGPPPDATVNRERYPEWNWSLRPRLRQHIGGPDGFYLYQLWLALSGKVELARGLSLSGTVGRNLVDTMDRISVDPASRLPRVRSDIKEYLQKGKNNIVRLQADYLFSPYPQWYARASAGLLEEMYGGVSAEILHRPLGAMWALGAQINWVRQREFRQRFGFRGYQTVTGHLELYYNLPRYDLLANLSIGRYLARDKGATLTLSRRFKSGVRAGAWITKTDVTSEEFGEGSFDKGFFITVPLQLFLTRSTRETGTFSFRPLTRDGGQRVSIANRLYPLVDEGGIVSIDRSWYRLLE